MKRWETILAIGGAGLLLVGAWFIRRSSLPHRDLVIVAGSCDTPATIFEPPAGVSVIGSAIFLHGLGANRRTMMFLGTDFARHGLRAYLLDLPGHGDNTDAFTYAKAEQCADASVESLLRGRVRGELVEANKAILIGHSMGGAIAIRMADRNPLAATIAISPAPLVLPRRMPANLLVFTGQFDLWPMRRAAGDIAAAAGGERTGPNDFAEDRAFRAQVAAHATHTSLIVDPAVAQRAEDWALQTLSPGVDSRTRALDRERATVDRLPSGGGRFSGAVMGLLGLALLFPAGATLAGSMAGPQGSALQARRPGYRLAIAETAVCALAAVLILARVIPWRFVHLYDGDYLASLLGLSGTLLLVLNRKYAKENLCLDLRAFAAAGAAGLVVFLAAGAWFSWQLGDLWMNAPRWLRFVELLPAAWIFCFAEEVVLGPVGRGKRRAQRFALFLAIRALLWLACLLAYYTLANGQVLLGVLVAALAVFSVLQRAATDALRLRTLPTGSATAAAVFGAILAAWFIAAVFPLT